MSTTSGIELNNNVKKNKEKKRQPKEEKKKKKSEAGRKWFDGKNIETVKAKLSEAISIDATIDEACFYANISIHSYRRYLKANPDFAIYLKALRNKPVLKARKRANQGIDESYSNAMDYLKRKKKDEFSERTETLDESAREEVEKLRKDLKGLFKGNK